MKVRRSSLNALDLGVDTLEIRSALTNTMVFMPALFSMCNVTRVVFVGLVYFCNVALRVVSCLSRVAFCTLFRLKSGCALSSLFQRQI